MKNNSMMSTADVIAHYGRCWASLSKAEANGDPARVERALREALHASLLLRWHHGA